MTRKFIYIALAGILFLFSGNHYILKGQDTYQILQKENKFGVANSHRKFVIPAIFRQIASPTFMIYPVQNEKGLWGFYSVEKKLTECLYDNFRFEAPDKILVQKQSRWGVLNLKGEELVEASYKYIYRASASELRGGKFNVWTVRNFKNEIQKTFEYDSITYLGDNVYRFCLAGKYGLLDQNNKIITTEYQDIFIPTLKAKNIPVEQTITASVSKTWFRVPLFERFDTVYNFSEGFAKFQSGGKYGFVDSAGNIRLVPQYTKARDFSDGMVAVMLLGKWGFMDTDEKLRVQPYYDEVSDFKNGFSIVRKEKKYYILNKRGTLLYSEPFDNISATPSGRYILSRGGKKGIADRFGHEILSTKYEDVQELGNSFIIAREHGLWGALNEAGNIVIPFNYSVIQYDTEHNLIITMEPGGEEPLNFKP